MNFYKLVHNALNKTNLLTKQGGTCLVLKRTCYVHIHRPNVKQYPYVLEEFETPGRKSHLDYNEVDLPHDFGEVYRDFFPNPTPWWRNSVCEKLERADVLARRMVLNVPEFYVGTIMAVTIADSNAAEKLNRFLGICIDRGGTGMRSWFILRNVIDHEGLEIKYLTYSPQIVEIEVIRLEKRLDEKLYYLRDCLPEYSTFPQDLDPVHLPLGEPVPVNETLAELKPRPWRSRWERDGLKGVKEVPVNKRMQYQAKLRERPWEKYDLMLEYRTSIDEDQQKKIYIELKSHYNVLESHRRRTKKLRETKKIQNI